MCSVHDNSADVRKVHVLVCACSIVQGPCLVGGVVFRLEPLVRVQLHV